MRFCKRSRFESWGSCCHSSWFSAKWSSQWNMWSEAAEICTRGPLIWGNGAARGNRGCICTRRNPVQWASYNLNFSQEESAHADSMAKLGQWSCKGKPWLHLDSKKVWLSGNLWASYNLNVHSKKAPMPIQPPFHGHSQSSEINMLRVVDLQHWMDRNYFRTCFANIVRILLNLYKCQARG